MRQSSQTLDDHERRFNRIAQPLASRGQYQTHLITLYIKSLQNRDLRHSLQSRVAASEIVPPTLGSLQLEAHALLRKFASIDAFHELYALRQAPHTPIAQHNYEIEKRLALLEMPMDDDLLQDLYRKSLRPDVAARLANHFFPSYLELRNAALRICP